MYRANQIRVRAWAEAKTWEQQQQDCGRAQQFFRQVYPVPRTMPTHSPGRGCLLERGKDASRRGRAAEGPAVPASFPNRRAHPRACFRTGPLANKKKGDVPWKSRRQCVNGLAVPTNQRPGLRREDRLVIHETHPSSKLRYARVVARRGVGGFT